MANGNFGERIQGLLGSPAFNAGVGLLAASGPRPQGTANFGSRLGEAVQFLNERQRAGLENQVMRQQLTANNRRQQALQQLPGLLGQQTTAQGPATQIRSDDPMGLNVDVPGQQAMVPRTATPEGQQELMGLLGQISPQAVSQGLLQQMQPQQQRAEPAPVRIARTLNDPNVSQGVKDDIRAQIDQGRDAEALNAQVQLELNRMRLQREAQEAQQQERDQRVQRQTAEVGLRRTLQNLEKAADLNEKLAPTMLRSGVTLPEARSAFRQGVSEVRRMFGADTSEAEQLIDDFNTFNKLTSELIIESMGRVAGSGLGSATNQRISLLNDSMAGIGTSPGANARIFSSSIQELLDVAEIEGFDIGNRDHFRSLAQDLESGEVPVAESTESGQSIDLGGGVTLEFID